MPQRNLLLLIAATVVSCVCFAQGRQNPYSRQLADGLATIEANALDQVPSSQLFAGAMDGMVEALRESGDQHSQFFNEAEAERLRSEIHQQVGGIGVRIGMRGDPPLLTILGPVEPNTPAGQAKLAAGDRIEQIDDQQTAGLNLRDALAMLNGKRGTTLRLTVRNQHDSQPRTVELLRELIPIESILGDRRDADGHWLFALEDYPQIAIIRITSFGDRTALELANILTKLTSDGVHAIVLDLRDNAGGALDSAVAVCEMLLPAGKTIVETRGRGQVLRQRYATKADGAYHDLPIAVLLNQNSASASEIVAACLQDQGRAIVIGQRSFGKGTVQQMLPLGKSLLKLTWASFWRPSGANIHRAKGVAENATWGVSPDAGYERILSPTEYEAFRESRRQRDEHDATTESQPADDFVDAPLQLAERALRAQLAEKP